MSISINNKGLSLDFKLYGLDNNFKQLLLDGRCGHHSPNGVQQIDRRNLAPGQEWNLPVNDIPSWLVIRAEGGIALLRMTIAQAVADTTAPGDVYTSTSGSVGDPLNYPSSIPSVDLRFEIDKLFIWSGTFISAIVRNPATAPGSLQVSVAQG